MTTQSTEKVEELRQSAQQLAKQAMETAELGMRLVRTQIEAVSVNQPPQVQEINRQVQATAATAETKAKELFTLATTFLNELNDKWQPAARDAACSTTTPAAEKPKVEKIDID